jgi:hypothetical protein
MTSQPDRFEHLLVRQIAARATGQVEGREDKKKWVFYLRGGELVGSKSNLKSEQPEAVLAQKADLSPAAVTKNVVLRRLKGALAGATAWEFVANSAPVQEDVCELLPLFHKALAQTREAAALWPVFDGHLKRAADLPNLGLPAAMSTWLAGLGGVSAGAQGGPGEDKERAAALWLAMGLGAYIVEGSASKEVPKASSPPAATKAAPPTAPPPAKTAAPAGLDIGALLGGVDLKAAPTAPVEEKANPWAPDKVVLPPAGGGVAPAAEPPPDFEEAEIEAIGVEGPVRLDAALFEAINTRPGRETMTMVETAPEPTPPTPVKHPMEDELRAAHAQIMAAPDHFAVLGVSWDAGVEAFRKAHLHWAQRLHPDRFADADDALQELANEGFDKVRAAWEVLGDADKRQAYTDQVIHGKKTEDQLAMEQVQNYWAAESEFKRGLAAFNAGRMREAHGMFEAAVQKVPDELEFRAYLGFTTFQTWNTRDAEKAEAGKEMLKEVVEKNREQQRKLDSAWVLLGRIYRDSNNNEAARKCFVQALKINPANGDATREMKRLHGGAPGQPAKKEDEKPGFFARLFGKK